MMGIALGTLLGELGLRLMLPTVKEYYIHRPFLRISFEPSPSVMPGIRGHSRFVVNSQGIRGDECAPGCTYRILAVGGSSTECAYLDQVETWPALLQSKLDGVARQRLWVGNAGKGGVTTRHHILQLRHLLNQMRAVDTVILLVGFNDLGCRLSRDTRYDPHFLERAGCEESLMLEAFSVLPVGRNRAIPQHKRTALWHLARRFAYRYLRSNQIQDREGRYLVSWREHRQHATAIRDRLPDLVPALEEYARNIDLIIDICRERSVRPVFLTQPVMWRPDLSPELEQLLCFGVVGRFQGRVDQEYYSVEALAAAMSRYNETLRERCAARGVECLDLAAGLPRDTTVFYDDCHFNERGAEQVAELVASYLLQREPFTEHAARRPDGRIKHTPGTAARPPGG